MRSENEHQQSNENYSEKTNITPALKFFLLSFCYFLRFFASFLICSLCLVFFLLLFLFWHFLFLKLYCSLRLLALYFLLFVILHHLFNLFLFLNIRGLFLFLLFLLRSFLLKWDEILSFHRKRSSLMLSIVILIGIFSLLRLGQFFIRLFFLIFDV